MTEQELLDSGAEIYILLFYSDTDDFEILEKIKNIEQRTNKFLVKQNFKGNIVIMGTRSVLAGFLSCLKGNTLSSKLGKFCRHAKLDDGWTVDRTNWNVPVSTLDMFS